MRNRLRNMPSSTPFTALRLPQEFPQALHTAPNPNFPLASYVRLTLIFPWKRISSWATRGCAASRTAWGHRSVYPAVPPWKRAFSNSVRRTNICTHPWLLHHTMKPFLPAMVCYNCAGMARRSKRHPSSGRKQPPSQQRSIMW